MSNNSSTTHQTNRLSDSNSTPKQAVVKISKAKIKLDKVILN
jgi:hypothetical protein